MTSLPELPSLPSTTTTTSPSPPNFSTANMSKVKSRKRVEEYDSDDGFIEDAAPKSKKQKKVVSGQKDDEGNQYWEISGKRRIQISDFKGQTFVGIREFYEKDGKMLPGKKVRSSTYCPRTRD
jgi:hypothetical protein